MLAVALAPPVVDFCRGLPDAQNHPPIAEPAPGNEVSLRLAVGPKGPVFRVTLRSTLAGGGDPDAFTHRGNITISNCRDGRLVQVLHVMARPGAPFATGFEAEDVNFDGWLDISVIFDGGGTWASSKWFIYDPASGRFVRNRITAVLAHLASNGTTLDKSRHEIVAPFLTERWGCGPSTWRYRVQANRLIRVHKEKVDPAVGGSCTITASDLIHGRWQVTEVRRFRNNQPVKSQ